MTYDLLWSHPVLRRIDREFDLTPHSDGWALPCPGCDAEAAPSGLFESDPTANYASVTVALSADGQRLRIRRCSGGCSALRIAVALNLEIAEFEPWDQPNVAMPKAPAAPESTPRTVANQQRGGEKRPKAIQPDPSYAALRACVQAVLDATEGEREQVVREQHEVVMAIPGVTAARAKAVLVAAATTAGMSETDAERAMEVWA